MVETRCATRLFKSAEAGWKRYLSAQLSATVRREYLPDNPPGRTGPHALGARLSV
jgi:hypothetical protein